MKIVKLVAENVKRLHAVEVTPGASPLITIGGKNGAGKSSVLDSIAYAMGGERLVPAEPIRAGESEARITVDLGDLVVTRRFKKDATHCACGHALGQHADGAPDSAIKQQCQVQIDPVGDLCPCQHKRPVYGETRSTLTVTNKDGARYPSPQAMLDKLLGRLTFDPLAFARDEPRRQGETLRKLVGLDLAPIEERRANAYQQRAILKKQHSVKEAQLLAMPQHPDAPQAEVPVETIAREMAAADEARKAADRAERERDAVAAEADQIGRKMEATKKLITDLEARLAQLNGELAELRDQGVDALNRLQRAQSGADAARAAVPDGAALRAKLAETEAANAKVRANERRAAAVMELAALYDQVQEQDAAVLKAEEEKKAALVAAKFPVEGLGLDDVGVTLGGLPFEQASSSEQLRVSVMVGLALNPTLKVLLIRNGNMLDDDSLAQVGKLAADAGAQVWVEWVTGDPSDVAVMLADGEVVS